MFIKTTMVVTATSRVQGVSVLPVHWHSSSNTRYGTLQTNDSVYQWKYSWTLIPMWVYAAVFFCYIFLDSGPPIALFQTKKMFLEFICDIFPLIDCDCCGRRTHYYLQIICLAETKEVKS